MSEPDKHTSTETNSLLIKENHLHHNTPNSVSIGCSHIKGIGPYHEMKSRNMGLSISYGIIFKATAINSRQFKLVGCVRKKRMMRREYSLGAASAAPT